jgi:hypothetical protein
VPAAHPCVPVQFDTEREVLEAALKIIATREPNITIHHSRDPKNCNRLRQRLHWFLD